MIRRRQQSFALRKQPYASYSVGMGYNKPNYREKIAIAFSWAKWGGFIPCHFCFAKKTETAMQGSFFCLHRDGISCIFSLHGKGGVPGMFGFKKHKQLNREQIIEKCKDRTLLARDIGQERIINIIGIAQGLVDEGNDRDAAFLVSLSIQNRPTALAGNFVLDNSLDVDGMHVFKHCLETKEERGLFCSLYRAGYITNENIGEVDEPMQEKIDLAFDEEYEDKIPEFDEIGL